MSGPDLTLVQCLRHAAPMHRRGPGEMQVAMTELSGIRVTTPLAADPRGFCALLAVLGRF